MTCSGKCKRLHKNTNIVLKTRRSDKFIGLCTIIYLISMEDFIV